MKKIFFAGVLIFAVAAGCNSNSSSGSNNSNSASNSGQNSSASQKFSDQSYYQKAYLISAPTLSAEAQKALNGFQMAKKNNADGSVTITLKAQKPGYQDQQYTLQAGQQLYFIEKFSGDDNLSQDNDGNLGDDTAVVVDAQGNVVQQPQGFQQ